MLRVTEIFYSLQGETTLTGWPTVFIRLTGCPLRCQYCDTAYAFHGGSRMGVTEIIDKVGCHHTHYVTVTGGEPLAQPECLSLLSQLCDLDYRVSLETSGALDIQPVDTRVIKILDLKTPGSKEVHRNRWENLYHLQPHDQIKFVVCDRPDYEWVKSVIEKYQLDKRHQILLSPSHGQLSNQRLADWILQDQLNVRFQLQLHKYIWGDEPGR